MLALVAGPVSAEPIEAIFNIDVEKPRAYVAALDRLIESDAGKVNADRTIHTVTMYRRIKTWDTERSERFCGSLLNR